VNLSTPWPEDRGLPFDELKALSVAEGLEVHPEPCFPTPPLQQEGGVSHDRMGEETGQGGILNG